MHSAVLYHIKFCLPSNCLNACRRQRITGERSEGRRPILVPRIRNDVFQVLNTTNNNIIGDELPLNFGAKFQR